MNSGIVAGTQGQQTTDHGQRTRVLPIPPGWQQTAMHHQKKAFKGCKMVHGVAFAVGSDDWLMYRMPLE